ncbi:ubiquitin-conjugating enzyme E2 28-like [Platysternon megacephalum]|uniref:Ubiquitin-conjugating enzyme E2 28-like n=1 Tax=Platysternon megacephalum TaxID=55544 RepID=A0A4D9DDG9_9SAUR|nr:ubiquitin-conjugating enzyme E2 28-like [Platysternon megacephalum]
MEQRRLGVPLQHLTGEAPFRHEVLAVGPGVFIPRPETELLAGWAIEQVRTVSDPTVVELCAGSGAISLAIATETAGCRQWAVELSDDALPYLHENLRGTCVDVVHGDMAEALRELDGQVDVVVANPPYIPLEAWESVPAEVRDYDPHMALFSGDDGLDAVRVLKGVAARLLRPGGEVGIEHAEVQHEQIVTLLAAGGTFDRVTDHRDLAGRWRYLTARRTKVSP